MWLTTAGEIRLQHVVGRGALAPPVTVGDCDKFDEAWPPTCIAAVIRI